MAQKLKMSRVGVWSRVDKLRKAGLSIDASQNRGYRLVAEPNLLNQPLLEAWLKECRKSCKVFVHDEVDSTNSEAERLLANGEKAPFAVLANTQRKGRGDWAETGKVRKVETFTFRWVSDRTSN